MVSQSTIFGYQQPRHQPLQEDFRYSTSPQQARYGEIGARSPTPLSLSPSLAGKSRPSDNYAKIFLRHAPYSRRRDEKIGARYVAVGAPWPPHAPVKGGACRRVRSTRGACDARARTKLTMRKMASDDGYSAGCCCLLPLAKASFSLQNGDREEEAGGGTGLNRIGKERKECNVAIGWGWDREVGQRICCPSPEGRNNPPPLFLSPSHSHTSPPIEPTSLSRSSPLMSTAGIRNPKSRESKIDPKSGESQIDVVDACLSFDGM